MEMKHPEMRDGENESLQTNRSNNDRPERGSSRQRR